MTFCLLNLGCAMRDAEDNAFVRYLAERFVSLQRFCDEEKWPARLRRYNEKFRNRAAHVDASRSKNALRLACTHSRSLIGSESASHVRFDPGSRDTGRRG